VLDTQGHRTLLHLLREQTALRGDQTYLVFEDKDGNVTELTYAELEAKARACAAGLAEQGVGKGDFVVVHLRNCPEVLITWFGLAHLGAILVPSNTGNTGAELEHVIGFSEARLAITEPDLLAPVEEAISRLGTDVGIVVARGDAGRHTAFEFLLSTGQEPPAVEVRAEDVCEMLFTSGTTRRPKAVMLSHANIVRAGLDTVHVLWLQPGERCFTSLPLFHVNGQSMSALAAMTVGGTLILLEEFRATKFWGQLRRHKATQTSVVAMQLRTLIAQPRDPADRDHQLRRVFFSINVSESDLAEFEDRFGVSVINGYGLSEANVIVISSPVAADRRYPSIGLPSPGRRLYLLDDDGNEVGPGEVGEICIDGVRGRDVMIGYYKDDEETEKAFRGGVLHTGDNAWADEDGYLYFFDRKKDVIKRAAENVSALEVEFVLGEHPKVAEVAVVGVPDAMRDEAVAAVVVPVEGSGLTEDEVVEFARGELSKFKVPTIVSFVDQLPKTAIGKVKKDELRKALTARPTAT